MRGVGHVLLDVSAPTSSTNRVKQQVELAIDAEHEGDGVLRNRVGLAAAVVRHHYTQGGQLPEVHPIGSGSGDLYEPEASRGLHQLPRDRIGRSDESDGSRDLRCLVFQGGVGIDPRHADAVRRVPAVGLQFAFARRHHVYRRGQWGPPPVGPDAIIGLGLRLGKVVSVLVQGNRILTLARLR